MIYECYQCEFKSTYKDNPSKHKKFKHEGVGYECRYQCNQCECKSHLTEHIKSKHQGVRYECEQCE